MASCTRVLHALEGCQRKHPHEAGYVCAHLQRAAGWCLFRQACPDEGEPGPQALPACIQTGCQPGLMPKALCPALRLATPARCHAACRRVRLPAGLPLPPACRPAALPLQWMRSRPVRGPAVGGPPLQGRQPFPGGATSRSAGRFGGSTARQGRGAQRTACRVKRVCRVSCRQAPSRLLQLV